MDQEYDIHPLLDASCRVALAAYLHDLGKFAERARLNVDQDRLAAHVTQYCPYHEAGGRGWHSHKHAAYTALAWDLIEKRFPELIGDDVSPFAAWNSPDVDDSIVNAASRHHKPETYLQWIVATADRVASGFEREEFDQYNAAEDKTREGRNHYTARQLTLFEQISLGNDESTPRRADLHYRYPLRPLSANTIFPVLANDYETSDNTEAQEEYRKLWHGFEAALGDIPRSHRHNWSLWLDHFDSAWACYTQAIPSATAFNVRPEVSLYDHSRATAAIATALWRYHEKCDDDRESVRRQLAEWGRPDWNKHKLLLIQGDFFGIQEFLFATGGETQKRAARLLRGRSFYVSLLTECAALKILDTLGLPAISQVINAAGKFLIVAPNTEETVERLQDLQKGFDLWFLEHSYGQAGIGLAWLSASCNDFLHGDRLERSPFGKLVDRLFEALNDAKSRRLDLCGAAAPAPIFEGFLDRFDNQLGVCAIDGRSPATKRLSDGPEAGPAVSALAADQIEIGKQLAHKERLLVTQKCLAGQGLGVDIFGYHVLFTGAEEDSGRFGHEAQSGNLRRAWDYSLPEHETDPLFSGYARRYINGYIPTFGDPDPWLQGRYEHLNAAASGHDPHEPKTFECIACDDRIPHDGQSGEFRGVTALTTVKGDVDNLGTIFEQGLRQPTFAKMAALSRQVNAFFAIWLPWYCRARYPSVYTVFAGGDDFFLIGPWRSAMLLARDMRKRFSDYVAANPQIHFSAGLSMTKPGIPVRQMGNLAERALDASKDRAEGDRIVKDGITCFGHTVSWEDFERLMGLALDLEAKRDEIDLSTGYLYGLQYLADMAEDLRRAEPRIENALWRSRFTYRTWRMLARARGMDPDRRRRWQEELGRLIAGAIDRHGAAFKIALFVHLYQHRN